MEQPSKVSLFYADEKQPFPTNVHVLEYYPLNCESKKTKDHNYLVKEKWIANMLCCRAPCQTTKSKQLLVFFLYSTPNVVQLYRMFRKPFE